MSKVKVLVGPENSARITRVRAAIMQLPHAEQRRWLDVLRRGLEKRCTVVAVGAGASGEWDETVQPDAEWDLELANWLDRGYTAVSDRVQEVARKGADAVSLAGWSLWPLAAAVAVLALAWRSK